MAIPAFSYKLKPGYYSLFALAAAELLLVTYCRNIAGPYISPVLLLISGLALGWIYIRIAADISNAPLLSDDRKSFSGKLAAIALFIATSIIIYTNLSHVFRSMPINDYDTSWSDIIPQNIVMTRRFMHGEMPYQPIHFNGYELYPTYLPLQWIPYTIAAKTGIDYRWIPAIFLWLSSLYHFLRNTVSQQRMTAWSAIASIWPMAIWTVMVLHDRSLFGVTVESLVASYYLLTANAIVSRSRLLLAFGIALCLFSRYSIIFWVPLCVVLLYLKASWRAAATIAGVVAVVFVVCYWLPFLRHDSQIFFKGYHYHSGAALGEWQHLNDAGKPVHLYNGLGMAAWSYWLLPFADVARRLQMHQMIHIAACLLAVLLPGIHYWRRQRLMPLNPFLLGSLKIYLTVFYCFIQIPYPYLFLTPLLITAVMLSTVSGRS